MRTVVLFLTLIPTFVWGQKNSVYTVKDFFFSDEGNEFYYSKAQDQFTLNANSKIIFKTNDSVSYLMYNLEYYQGIIIAKAIDSIKISSTDVKQYSVFTYNAFQSEKVKFKNPQVIFKMPVSSTQKANWIYSDASDDEYICISEYSSIYYNGQDYSCVQVTRVLKPKGRPPLTSKIVDYYALNKGLVKTVVYDNNYQSQTLLTYLWQMGWDTQ